MVERRGEVIEAQVLGLAHGAGDLGGGGVLIAELAVLDQQLDLADPRRGERNVRAGQVCGFVGAARYRHCECSGTRSTRRVMSSWWDWSPHQLVRSDQIPAATSSAVVAWVDQWAAEAARRANPKSSPGCSDSGRCRG